LTDAVLSGDVTPDEASAAARIIDSHRKMIELVVDEERMTELEEAVKRMNARPPSHRERVK
jgi:hypothetical protein